MIASARQWRGQRDIFVSARRSITLLAIKFLNLPISASSAWHTLAGGVLALAQ
jgi:hypothetical protein